MDHGLEARVGFVAAHGDAFELLQLAKEVLNEVPPFVDFMVDVQRCLTLRHLRDDDLGPPLVQLVDDPVRIKRLVGKQSVELDALDQRGDAHRVVSVPRQQDKADEIAQSVGQCQDFGRQATPGAANGWLSVPLLRPGHDGEP